MTKRIQSSLGPSLLALFIILIALLAYSSLKAQSDCRISKYHGSGYTTEITSVTPNGNNSHTIVLTVSHDGCNRPECKALSSYSVEALPGTYSNISIAIITGNMTYGGIEYGPALGGDPFKGFRIKNTSRIGNGEPGSFTITYRSRI